MLKIGKNHSLSRGGWCLSYVYPQGCAAGNAKQHARLLAGLLAKILVLALHEFALAVEVQALLQTPLTPHIQADLQGATPFPPQDV